MNSASSFALPARALVWSAAFCLCGGLSSCLIGASSRTDNSGKYVSEKTLAQIQPGHDKAYVVALIGQPTEKNVIGDGTELWKWSYTHRKNSRGHVIFLVSTNKQTETEHTTFVEFRDSKVIRAWTD